MRMSSEENTETIPNSVFTQTYKFVPLINRSNKDIERGGKLILPASALEEINDLDISFPLMFKVTNSSNNQSTHAGVLEFTAKEGQVNIPQWMISYLRLQPGDKARVETVSLPSATHCTVEALTRNFAYVLDTKQLLENSLRYFSCLTEGDVFFIYDRSCRPYQRYKLKIAQTKPERAVNIFECDLEVDYSVPAPRQISNNKTNSKEEENKKLQEFKAFQGTGNRLDGRTVRSNTNKQKTCIIGKTFIAFNGTGHALQNKKRKSEENNDDKPPHKKKKEDEMANRPSELIFIREQQKQYLRTQYNEKAAFPGQGRSMKDN